MSEKTKRKRNLRIPAEDGIGSLQDAIDDLKILGIKLADQSLNRKGKKVKNDRTKSNLRVKALAIVQGSLSY